MKITVILCTFNRCESLAKTLESIAASQLPNSIDWEVLVVDNNSTDRTREMVEEFSRRYPGIFRYEFEPQPGKAYALNTGVRKARGKILAFVDDDVTVNSTWLQNLTSPLMDGNWAGVGGRTLLAEGFSPPPWLELGPPLNLEGVLAAVFDLGSDSCQLDQPPYGANMAFQMEVFEKYGLFRTDLGPSPTKAIPKMNDDVEFGRRLLTAGERLRYEPKAVVYHALVMERVRKSYFLNWWFDYGRALIREKGTRPKVWGIIPRHYFGMLKIACIPLLIRSLRWMCTFNPRRRFSYKCWAWVMVGQFVETYRLARDPQG